MRLPIYSGRPGGVIGDHIKSASGLGVPLVAVGLFYSQGYFRQHLDNNGYQREEYQDTKVENTPLEPHSPRTGSRSRYAIDTRAGQLFARCGESRWAVYRCISWIRTWKETARGSGTDEPPVRWRRAHHASVRSCCWGLVASGRCARWASRPECTI